MLKVKQMQMRIEELRVLVVSLDRQIDAALDMNDEAEASKLEEDAKRLVDEASDLNHILHYVRVCKQPKNEWFWRFVKSFTNDQRISEKQQAIFDRYGDKTIVDGVVYSVCERRVYITHLPEIWKEYA